MITVYVDGAAAPNPGMAGWAVIIHGRFGEKELCRYGCLGVTTNNVAELTAIKKALYFLQDESEDPIRIMTDSKYAIGTLTLGWKITKNRELIMGIREDLRKFPKIEFVYVRSEDNPADPLAKSMTKPGITLE